MTRDVGGVVEQCAGSLFLLVVLFWKTGACMHFHMIFCVVRDVDPCFGTLAVICIIQTFLNEFVIVSL